LEAVGVGGADEMPTGLGQASDGTFLVPTGRAMSSQKASAQKCWGTHQSAPCDAEQAQKARYVSRDHSDFEGFAAMKWLQTAVMAGLDLA
jgi:hypothetical protein